MNKHDTSGPAFPVGPAFPGMSLRDYFAAEAMPMAFDYVRRINPDGHEDTEEARSESFRKTYSFEWDEESGRNEGDVFMVAELAYAMADAMLQARQKPTTAD